ncbi:MAG: polysaccharide deacetylase family protein [Bacteroidales bacterium]|nr:polysaccharide deacetylase family protein [Bacteroidales bacterium]
MQIIVHPPKFIRNFFKHYIWKITPENDQKILYITIDDGPIPEMTPNTLKLLKRYNAKATFFCVGENVTKYPDIYNQIIREGHSVGNHTFNHLKGMITKTKNYIENIKLADNYIKTNLFRPPHGRIKNRETSQIISNKQIIMWDILSKDYDKKITPIQCWLNVEKNISSGSIIVFHDNIKALENQRYALEKTLQVYSGKGYQFKPLPDGYNNLGYINPKTKMIVYNNN